MIDNFGLIILAPKNNLRDVQVTVSWLEPYAKDIIAIFPEPCTQNICESYSCNNNLSDMINFGMHHSKNEWNLVVQAGMKFKSTFFQRLKLFIKSKEDIIYPISTKWLNFPEGLLSWFLMNYNTFKNVGDFPYQEDIRLSKFLWMERALKKKCNFKGIIGIKSVK